MQRLYNMDTSGDRLSLCESPIAFSEPAPQPHALRPTRLHDAPRVRQALAHLLDEPLLGLHPQPLCPDLHVPYPLEGGGQDHRGELVGAHANALFAEGRVARPDSEGLLHAAALELVQNVREELVVLLCDRLQFVRLALHGGVLLFLLGLRDLAPRPVLGPRWGRPTLAGVSPGVAAARLVTLVVGAERYVGKERLRVGDEDPEVVDHPEPGELLFQGDVDAQSYLYRALPPVPEPPIVHRVGEARAAGDEALGLLRILPRHRQHIQPETLLWLEPVVVAVQALLAHAPFLPLSTPSRASRRSSSSSSSLILRSCSIALRRVFVSWLATAALPVSTSPASTLSVRSSRSALTEESSRLGLLLAALEALRFLSAARSGSCW